MKENFISRLKLLMIYNNDNYSSLARKINVSCQAVFNWLNGKRIPKITYIERIADCYEVSTDYLLRRTSC